MWQMTNTYWQYPQGTEMWSQGHAKILLELKKVQTFGLLHVRICLNISTTCTIVVVVVVITSKLYQLVYYPLSTSNTER